MAVSARLRTKRARSSSRPLAGARADPRARFAPLAAPAPTLATMGLGPLEHKMIRGILWFEVIVNVVNGALCIVDPSLAVAAMSTAAITGAGAEGIRWCVRAPVLPTRACR
jgi:hypothetical protein